MNTKTSAQHCGSCNNACPSGQSCESGACKLVCSSGTTACSGQCVNTSTNVAHCGGCGKACSSGQACVSGACQSTCSSGTTSCSGSCVDLQTDATNCGSCGKACANGETCAAGACKSTCTGGTTSCGGSCVDIQTDSKNCGSCGMACATNQTCQSGSCKAPSTGSAYSRCTGSCPTGFVCLNTDPSGMDLRCLKQCGSAAACPTGFACRYEKGRTSGNTKQGCFRECKTQAGCTTVGSSLGCWLTWGVCVGQATAATGRKGYEDCVTNANCDTGFECIDVRFQTEIRTLCMKTCTLTCPSGFACRGAEGDAAAAAPKHCYRRCTSLSDCSSTAVNTYCSTSRNVCLVQK